MENKKKVLFSLIGIGAVVVPAILLITLTSRPPIQPSVSSGGRQIDSQGLDEIKRSTAPSPTPFQLPSPSPIVSPSPSSVPSPSPGSEGTSSSQTNL